MVTTSTKITTNIKKTVTTKIKVTTGKVNLGLGIAKCKALDRVTTNKNIGKKNRLRVKDKEDLSLEAKVREDLSPETSQEASQEVRVKAGQNQEASTKIMISTIKMTTNTSKIIMGVDRAKQKV